MAAVSAAHAVEETLAMALGCVATYSREAALMGDERQRVQDRERDREKESRLESEQARAQMAAAPADCDRLQQVQNSPKSALQLFYLVNSVASSLWS